MAKVLVVSNDVVGPKMAGPGIRSWEFARQLSKEHEVVLVAAPNSSAPTRDLSVLCPSRVALWRLVKDSDVVVHQAPKLITALYALLLNKPIAIDIYDPYPIADLEDHKALPPALRRRLHHLVGENVNLQLLAGDFFLCASEKQRDFWFGMLKAAGRLSPELYDLDVTQRRLINVVPFGLPADNPRHSHHVLKGVHPGIGSNDRVLLWGGGIWNWLDPFTLLRAMAQIGQRRRDIKLLFLGITHPNVDVTNRQTADAAIHLSKELGLYDQTVFFNEGWVPYEERQNYLLDADIGVSTHHDHLEARFSYRTRLLDCLWANRPIVCSGGDAMGELVQQEGLGIVVDGGNVEQLAEAILRLVEDGNYYQACQENLKRVRPRFAWPKVIEPLNRFCASACLTPDKTRAYRARVITKILLFYAAMVLHYLRLIGARATYRKFFSFSRLPDPSKTP